MKLLIEDDPARAAAAAARTISRHLASVVSSRGSATVAFSGGSTPSLMFDALVTMDVPWPAVEVFQVDERVAAADDLERNWLTLSQRLLRRVDLPEQQQHPMPVLAPDLTAAAGSYTEEIAMHAPDGLDVVHLGLGDDGHTASWPPGDPVVDAVADVAVVGPYRGRLRMTLTPRAVNRAGLRVWLACGEGKRSALAGLLARRTELPASAARQEADDVVATDEAAAAGIVH